MIRQYTLTIDSTTSAGLSQYQNVTRWIVVRRARDKGGREVAGGYEGADEIRTCDSQVQLIFARVNARPLICYTHSCTVNETQYTVLLLDTGEPGFGIEIGGFVGG